MSLKLVSFRLEVASNKNVQKTAFFPPNVTFIFLHTGGDDVSPVSPGTRLFLDGDVTSGHILLKGRKWRGSLLAKGFFNVKTCNNHFLNFET